MNNNKLPIARYRIAGKRRMVIYSKDLATISGMTISEINELHKKSQLRKGQDWAYNPDREDFALSLASAQAIMVMADTNKAWDTHHAITDFLQGFKR